MPGTGTLTLLFTDLVASTESLVALGEDRYDSVRDEHDALVGGAITVHHGEIVKHTGDGYMAVFRQAADAVGAAAEIQRLVATRNPGSVVELSIRIGISAGDVTERAGDYHGVAAVEAARLCAVATGGQILASETVHSLVGSRGGHEFVALGELDLKGLPPLATVAVRWGDEAYLAAPAGGAKGNLLVSVPLPVRLAVPNAAFVGREDERALLDTGLKAVQSEGRRRAVLIAGAAGIGKTTLAAHFARAAHDDGAVVLAGHCDEDLGIPYQPWAEAMTHLVRHAPESLLRAHVSARGCELTRLAPNLGHRVRTPPPTSGDPETERYLLFGAVIDMLERVSQDVPLVLVLDDLHWADRPTLQLLRHVIAAEAPLHLLGVLIHRDTELSADQPIVEALTALHRETEIERISLRGLDADSLGALLEAAAGHSLDADGLALRDALADETDGNPFFTREILRHLAETGAISQRGDGRWIAEVEFKDHGTLPASVREVIGRRVARLGEETEQTLRAASVIGREFDLDLLARVTDHTEDHILDLLEGALRAVVIREEPQRPGRLSFSHALIEHTLYDDLGPTRRQRLHRRVAAALEVLCGDGPADRLGELAYHWVRASQPADAPKAIEYALRAGDHALDKLAPDDAVNWYEQALELVDRQPVADELARCDALVRLGTAQRQAGDPRSRETLLTAAHLAQRFGDSNLLMRAALANNRGRGSVTGAIDQERIDSLEAALEATAATETPERAMLLETLATELTWGDQRRARALSNEALLMARRVGDDLTLCHILERRPLTIFSPATLEERTANAYELHNVAERLGDRHFRVVAAINLRHAAMSRGNVAEADEHIEVQARAAAQTGLATERLLVAQCLAWRRLLAGHVDEAEQAANEGLRIGTQSGEADAFAYYAGQILEIRRAQGRVGEIIELVARAVVDNPGIAAFRAALACCLCEVDRFEDAREVFDPLFISRFTNFQFVGTWLTAMTFSADTAAYLEHRAAAVLLADQLAPWRRQLAYNAVTCQGSVARPLGLALATAGRLDEADEAFAQAAAVHERIDAPIELARTQVNWAGMLATREQPGDTERARQLLDRALTSATNLGLATIERQAQKLLTKLAGK